MARTPDARVALVHCPDYDQVEAALARALAPLGGMGAFVKPGQRVLVKPNLLTDAEPHRAKTTHPAVVRAVIRRVRQHGAEPFVADSPASVIKLEHVWEKTGMRAVCREEDVPLVNLEQGGAETFTEEGFTFAIARRVLEADAIVSVPKVKTHVLTGFTCGVKNMYGCVAGLQKTALHKQYFRHDRFGHLLALIYRRTQPRLVVADGIVGMEGNGPTAGKPVPLGLLAASADAVALDRVLCDRLGLDAAAVTFFRPLERMGIGPSATDPIERVGDPPEALRTVRFQPPNTLPARLVPGWLVGLLRPLLWSRPGFLPDCVSCGLCVRTCPAAALAIPATGQRPVLTPSRCIECCCCHEVCPHRAIEMTMSPLLRLAKRRQQCLRPPANR